MMFRQDMNDKMKPIGNSILSTVNSMYKAPKMGLRMVGLRNSGDSEVSEGETGRM